MYNRSFTNSHMLYTFVLFNIENDTMAEQPVRSKENVKIFVSVKTKVYRLCFYSCISSLEM